MYLEHESIQPEVNALASVSVVVEKVVKIIDFTLRRPSNEVKVMGFSLFVASDESEVNVLCKEKNLA